MKPSLITLTLTSALFLACTAEKKAPDTVTASPGKVRIYQTAQSSAARMADLGTVEFAAFGQPLETQPCVFIDPTHTFQTVIGIGGALTDASAETFFSLSKAKQQELLTAYFDPDRGLGYSLARTNIQSCDFSSESYAYVERGDLELKSFSIAHDKSFKIPFIKKAMAAAGGHILLYASPWSPPAWMKTNDDMLHGGKLKPECAQAWANLYVKFIQAYEAEGIPVWGLSVQNEPMATQTWESCIFTAEEERDFVKKYIGPTLARSGMAGKKLIVWDHNRDLLYQRASTILNDPEAARYVWGVGFHWYMNDVFDNVKRVHEAFPEINLIFTEGCTYPYSTEKLGEWHWGERYGESLVRDFNNGAVGWTDWNVLLDEKGGPNHVGNYCYAPVHKTAAGDLYYMNSFYYLGHFSKFVRPGARRIIACSNRDKLLTTGFVNPDGKLAVIVLNLSDETLPYKLWRSGMAADVTSLPHSIMTLIID